MFWAVEEKMGHPVVLFFLFHRRPPPAAPKVTSSSEILVELKKIPDFVGNELLIAYAKVTANERTFESLMALPMELRKAWLMTLP